MDRYCSAFGSVETGKMIPDSKICGTTTSGMNCTAWNSERANMLRKMPRFTAAIAISASMPKIKSTLPWFWIFNTASEKISTSAAWTRAMTVKPSM